MRVIGIAITMIAVRRILIAAQDLTIKRDAFSEL